MFAIKNKQECCGCYVCGDVCPKAAISFVSDEEGFVYPKVDEGLCVKCGLCLKTCPIKAERRVCTNSTPEQIEAYAAVNRDLRVRFDSTSGGLYSALAESVLAEGGYIGGAVWNADFSISQIVTSEASKLEELRSSKYAQSDATGFYRAVKAAVETGKKTLVCGTPCQISAIRQFLKKDYENLFLVDFICRGSNSPLIMRRYIEYIEEEAGAKVVAIKQKSKELGWRRLTTKFTLSNGKVVYDPRERSLFMRGYLSSNIFCRPSCYECRFKGVLHEADITLADCWGAVNSVTANLDQDVGTSLVLCNTARGKALFDAIKGQCDREPLDLKEAIDGNLMLVKSLPPPKEDRERFFRRLVSDGFKSTMTDLIASTNKPVKQLSTFKRFRKGLRRAWKYRANLTTLIRLNGLRNILENKPLLIPEGRVVLFKAKGARIIVNRDTIIGRPRIKGEAAKTRLLLYPNSVLIVNGGLIMEEADISIFPSARLEIEYGFYANRGLEIVCGQSIKIGGEVAMGPHVAIRDINGDHIVNSPGYRTINPIEIGEHVWCGTRALILPGVSIGSGSVVAAGSVVTKAFAVNTLIGGVPAKSLREHVEWR